MHVVSLKKISLKGSSKKLLNQVYLSVHVNKAMSKYSFLSVVEQVFPSKEIERIKTPYAFSIACHINWIDSINGEQVNRSLRFLDVGTFINGSRSLWIAINPFSRQGGVALWRHTPRLTRDRLAPLFKRPQKQWRGVRGVAGSLNASSNPFCRLVKSRKRSFVYIYMRTFNNTCESNRFTVGWSAILRN